MMAERETVIDFTVPYYDLVGITIMMKRQKVETSLFRFLTVLEDSVWACILAAYFFTSFLMWIFDKFSPYSYQNNLEKFKEDEEKRNVGCADTHVCVKNYWKETIDGEYDAGFGCAWLAAC